ncbi:transporter G family member [Seminavis robusta]|uniref:Transporter G family member n=1 Tax=Seminavis robusta TaxID=568900 RepID=A0A9N8EY13_9STRA|nr:transporter G family member [Seminavis robusta]|eukprot:Sro1943_g306880.1 transporter G family member (411) ;mRNA; f:18290-19522
MRRAPNFASAILGTWVAAKLGLASADPVSTSRRDTGVASSILSSAREQVKPKDAEEFVFKDIDALLLPGEGTMLLGTSSSGKTTLMRTIQDVIGGTAKNRLKGSISMGKLHIPAAEAATTVKDKNYGRMTAFVDQGDLSLTPIMTVEETIRFARLCAEGKHDFIDESILEFLKLLGLDHVKDTVVGNSDIRGVSSGQKRRVKVLEMAVGADVTCLLIDEPPNGLDAASALSLCQVLGTSLRTSRTTAMVSLLQPSTEVFDQFQRLDSFAVLPYFENTLGLIKPNEMNVPEFLLRCIYAPQEFQEGEVPKIPLVSAEDFAKAFQQSHAGKDLEEEIKAIKENVAASDGMTLPELNEWAISTVQQILLLASRGWQLVMHNPLSIMRIILAVFLEPSLEPCFSIQVTMLKAHL